MYKAGEAFHVNAGKVHEAKATGGPAVVIANYVIEKREARDNGGEISGITWSVGACKPRCW